MKLTAIIFDMDGVLVDSEPIYAKMNRSLFSHFGFEVSDAEHNSFVGYPSKKIWSYLGESRDRQLDMEQIMDYEKKLTADTFTQADLEPMPGLIELLERLTEQEVPLSIASSSGSSTIDLITKKIGIQDYFRHLVSGQQVTNGKPSPDIFLLAAELLGVKPEACLVIEDSRNGARAAKSAGMTCIGFNNPNSGNQDLSICDQIIDSFDQTGIEVILGYLNH